MATTLSSLIKNNQLPAIAGKAINQNDLVQMISNGKVYPCGVSDYVATPNSGTVITASTAQTYYDVGAQRELSWLQDSTGNTYIVQGNGIASTTGVVISKYAPSGAIIASAIVDTTTTATSNAGITIKFLSTGNIVVTWASNTAGTARFAIVKASDMSILVASTAMHSVSPNYYTVTCQPIATGGFVIAYANTNAVSTLDLYTNAGVWVSSVNFTVQVANEKFILRQLSNGNILLVQNEISFAIWTAALVVVVAPTNWIATSTKLTECVVINGFFCLSQSYVTLTTASIAVYNNAGTLQGSLITVAKASGGSDNYSYSLQTDGTYFYVAFQPVISTYSIYQVNTSGVLVSTTPVASGAASAVFGMDQLGNYIQFFSGSTTLTMNVFDPSTLTVTYYAFSAFFLTSHRGSGVYIPLDGALFWQGKADASSIADIGVTKVLNTAIIGVAQSTVAAGSTVQVVVDKGYYQINALKGTTSKSFTMKTVANIYGNNGTISGIAVTQQGM